VTALRLEDTPLALRIRCFTLEHNEVKNSYNAAVEITSFFMTAADVYDPVKSKS